MKERENKDKETRKRKSRGGRDRVGEGKASALGRELEGWIFFMKGFEGRAGRAPRLVLKP